jgi:predicted AAA+ superfamily ATPase
MEKLLEQYNPHWNQPHNFDLIPRASYSKQILDLANRKEISVLKGIRRSGKSSLLKLVINALVKKGVSPKNILFMNLEDYRFGGDKSVHTLDEIYQAYIGKMNPQKKVYILLDEIQEIPGFEKWLRTYYEQNDLIKFMITGSSSSLFSKELATLLTGRQIPVEIFPFSFSEFLDFKTNDVLAEINGKSIDSLYLSRLFPKIEPLLQRYLDQGGFPEMVKNEEAEGNVLALQQYIGDIILRDIAQRYNIRKIEVLQKLTLYLIYNMGNVINVSRLAELVGSNRTTVLELIAYLKEVYMIFTTSSFSFSLNEQLTSTRPKRVYCIDNGFFAAIKTNAEKDFAKKLKNIVFQHLRFRWGEELFYWKEKVEIDFVLKDGFPVSVSVDEKDKDREVYRLFHYLHQHNLPLGILISWNKLQILEENERKIMILPLWLFLTKSQQEILEYES